MKYAAVLILLCAFACDAAAAGLVDDINQLRRKGCKGRSVDTPLRADRELDAVAREWSRGGRLRDALASTGYRAQNSASMRIEGAPNETALLRALIDNYCETLTDPSFTTIGLVQRRGEVHIVVAMPLTTPAIRDADVIARRALDLVNEARAKPRKCGSTAFPATTPLQASALLARAALIHAQDMASRNFFEHEGSDGSQASSRVTRVGYEWRSVGENIAAGPGTAESVVDGWLKSPGHCANLMSDKFTEMGIAFATNPKSDAGIYWAQVFARPRK
ncbi:MAG TPA: CAP domain-containing protein [Povalibacter sp.]|uniref:CAP domain-containing protein n=1 Tax=Povalibacter sp. TaxID=1962978 RepID=UPI002CF0DC6D|nr:CAP domain-containing protein [Povalibacter sp.]HMN47340.1 CAP domain-containing protein [Povalibacter sp.]